MNLPFQYSIIYSQRKSVSIEVRPDNRVIVRAPERCPRSFIDSFIYKKADWVMKHLELNQQHQKEQEQRPPEPKLTDSQRRRYIETARSIFTQKAAYYARIMGVTYNRIAIREQKTRWGSCSSKGTLSFNWRLMLAPPAILDYVVVHELCHLTHMDHSKAFWQAVASVYPDYAAARKWLKEHGRELVL